MAEGDYSFKAVINADTSSFQKNIKQAQNSVSSLSGTFSGLSKVISKALSFAGITMSVGAIVKFGKESVKAAESANKSFNILNNTIKVTGATAWTTTDDIVQMSKELADSSNYAVSEIQDMQSVLLGFRNITGDTFEAASEAIMDMATVMGMDLKSATQTVGKALDDPVKGLDSLRRQGFQFTDEQKAELEQLVKNGKQLEAQKIILDELATTYGGAARAAQSSFAKAKNATIELKETLGNQLMPVVNEVLANSTNTIKQLTVEIQKIDFSRIYASLKNIANMIKPAFEDIVNYFRDFGNEIKQLFKSDTIKPFASLLDITLGILKAMFNEIKSNFDRVKDVFSSMREGLGGLADSGALKNVSNVINKIIDVIWFLREQILKIQEDIKALTIDRIKAIWSFFKQLFDNSNKALEENEKAFASWGEFFYSIFDQVFRVAQDLINGVSAILHGNWAVAWEYAKLATMRACKVVLDAISQIANAFPALVNKIIKGVNWIIEQINKLKKFFGEDPIDLAQAFEGVDLTESSGLGKAIADAEKKIEELTGKAADTSIKSLQGISQASQGMAQSLIADINDVTDTYVSNAEKQYAATEDANSDIEDDSGYTYEMCSEWDSKLLEQRLSHLKEWQKEYHDISLQLIEEERKKALEADKTGADAAKINKYYDNMVLDEKKRYFKAMLTAATETVKKIANAFKSLANIIKSAISSVVNIFKSLFDFNIDDALDNILKFEDSILTFFVETLPKLPGFVASVLQSISTLIKSVLSSGGFASFGDILGSIVKNIVDEAPKIIDDLVPAVERIINGILDAITGMDFNSLLDTVMGVIEWVMNSLVTYIPKILQIIIGLIKNIIQKLPTALNIIIQGIMDLIKAILPELPTIITMLFDAVSSVLKENLPTLISELIKLVPVFLKVAVEITVEIIKRLPELIGMIIEGLVKAFTSINWWELIKECFMGFINGFKKLFGIHSPSTVFEDFGKNILQGLLNGFKDMTKKLQKVFKDSLNAVKKLFDNMGDWAKNAWENVKKGFSNVGDWFKTAFDGAGNNIVNAFGNMRDIGSTIWENIKSGFGDVGEWFKNIFTGGANAIKKAFEGIGDWFKKIFDGIVNVLKSPINLLIKGINFIIDGLNKISIKIPDWVPGIGGKKFGVSIPNISYLATGTQNAQKGLAIVGEAGPELVRFNGGEQVLNTKNTQKALANAGNGGGTVFNITFENTIDTTAFTMMKQLKQYQRNLAFNGVL